MFSLEILITTVIILLYFLHLLIKKISYWKRLPPGPWGFPVIGSMMRLTNAKNLFEEFEKYTTKYGKLFSLGIGNFDVVVINDAKLIQQAFKMEELCGRPHFEIWINRNMGELNRGILLCDANKTWMEQRRFALRSLRDFGFGKDSIEGLVLYEVEQLVTSLRGQVGNPVSLASSFNASVLNSLWLLVTGRRIELNDQEFHQIIEGLAVSLRNAYVFGPGFYYPWPAKYNLIRKGIWEKQLTNYKRILNLIQVQVNQHEETYDPEVTRDFTDAYLHETKKCQPDSSFTGEEGGRNLLVLLHDLFFAGVETTSTTLLWAIFYICQNPRVQKKVHDEIDKEVGHVRQITKSDKNKLGYIEAVLNETHRLASILPFATFHRVQKDIEFAGYKLPEGVLIYSNLYEAHHNKAYWGDPDQFRPERFLDVETQSKLVKHEPFMPFSTGKRICLGESLARDELFLFFANLMQQFEFMFDEQSAINYCGSNGKQQSPGATLILSPTDFNVVMISRHGTT